jgi:protoheme IX farnesyltransferase
MKERLNFYLFGYKSRVTSLVLVTAALGFFLAQCSVGGQWTAEMYGRFFVMLLGTLMSCSGASILNQVIERETDARMGRTKNRPIAAGVIPPAEALAFGILLVLAGVTMLAVLVNLLTAFLALLTAFLYVVVYTPLKKITWLNTIIGAIPGALPPLGGWAAVTDSLPLLAWVLFFIVFLWQHPHFYAIAWMYREDYAKAGLKMLPVVEPSGESTFRQIILFTVALIVVSLLPVYLGVSGEIYLVGAVVSGAFYLLSGVKLAQAKSIAAARGVLRTSIWYLPVVLALIALDLR